LAELYHFGNISRDLKRLFDKKDAGDILHLAYRGITKAGYWFLETGYWLLDSPFAIRNS